MRRELRNNAMWRAHCAMPDLGSDDLGDGRPEKSPLIGLQQLRNELKQPRFGVERQQAAGGYIEVAAM